MSVTNNTSQPLTLKLKWDEEFVGKELGDLFNEFSFPSALFILHRKIEQQYRQLPWPSSLRNVTLFTQVCGGRGDIAAAAKTISLMQSLDSKIAFTWILTKDNYDVLSFLPSPKPEQLTIGYLDLSPPISQEEGILILGPAKCMWSTNYIESRLGAKIRGPRFAFLENAEDPRDDEKAFGACVRARKEPTNYKSLHTCLFRSTYGTTASLGVPMGLQEGTGIFLDQSRLNALRSRAYFCPKYLQEIEEASLKEDILAALPDADHHSFNSGYAHRSTSWGKFIDFTAVHEQKKHVTIVLNQFGEFQKYSTEEFKDKIFTKERIEFLKAWGYGTLIVKGKENEPIVVLKSSEPNLRMFTVIVRQSFLPTDMKRLQLASERILATGDNTAAEAWASRCILYLYEDVSNLGCKEAFLQQQVAIASKIDSQLAEFLRIGGKNDPLSKEEMDFMITCLQNPSFSQHTLDFCTYITEHFSFRDVLEGALKRVAWQYCLPELVDIEITCLDDSVKQGILDHFKDFTTQEQLLTVNNLSLLGSKVYERVMAHLGRQNANDK